MKFQATSICQEKKKLIALLVNFIKEIGLTVEFAIEEDPGFLPGIRIKNGGLSIDPDQVLYLIVQFSQKLKYFLPDCKSNIGHHYLKLKIHSHHQMIIIIFGCL